MDKSSLKSSIPLEIAYRSNNPFKSVLLPGIQSLSDVISFMNLSSETSTAPDITTLPREILNNGLKYHISTSSIQKSQSTGSDWTVFRPYTARVSTARWLTFENVPTRDLIDGNWDKSRSVVHMEISLGDSGITYVPGDSIGICCPNPRALVDAVISKICESSTAKVGPHTLLTSDGNEFSLQELLSERFVVFFAQCEKFLPMTCTHINSRTD